MVSQCHGDLVHYLEFLSLFSGDQHHAGSGNTSGNVSAVVFQLSSVVCMMHQPCDSLLKNLSSVGGRRL
ncbi:hypothetical protein FRX31_019265 [Thalictrum thalictroides]|uniref:Uncharacterized protein n=1 Tax=Thalictrum thalictroides TaxID=46969 RepID=A0A7J6W2X6_THATH|nr:hypothetical protein FRX31_019265 [Thalictrum thalictroides]